MLARALVPAYLIFAPVGALLFAQPGQGEWKSMFDGKTLAGWNESEFKNHATVRVEESSIVMPFGKPMTGISWDGEFPKSNYEVRFEGARKQGNDFFASLTFPVKDSYATWVLGGWGGDIVGISSIDGWDASDNETRSYFTFETNRWYKLRLQVTDSRIQAWIDDQPVVNVVITGRTIGLRPGDIKYSLPLGFASYNSTGALRKIEYRTLAAKP